MCASFVLVAAWCAGNVFPEKLDEYVPAVEGMEAQGIDYWYQDTGKGLTIDAEAHTVAVVLDSGGKKIDAGSVNVRFCGFVDEMAQPILCGCSFGLETGTRRGE